MENIAEVKSKPNQDAVKVLEDALEKAKSGEYESVAVCWVTNTRCIDCECSSSPNRILMWSSIEHAARLFYSDVVCSDLE